MSSNSTDLESVVAALSVSLVDVQHALDTCWLLIASYLVFIMQLGFALLEAGCVRAINTKNIIILDTCISIIMWWLIGFGISQGEYGPIIGDMRHSATTEPSDYAVFIFLWAFNNCATTIVSGSVTSRIKFSAYMASCVLLSGFTFPLIAYWTWGYGWLGTRDPNGLAVIDYAGGTVVHIVGGVSGLVGAIIVGPRTGRWTQDADGKWVDNKEGGHSIIYATIGVFLLWFGWFGFNSGSTQALSNGQYLVAATCAVNTLLATAAGGIVITCHFVYFHQVHELWELLNGMLCGLVAITPCCATVPSWAAVIIGGSSVYAYLLGLKLVRRLRIDDVVDAFPVHGCCGIYGTICAGVFSTQALCDAAYGVGRINFSVGHQLPIQLAGCVSCIAVAATAQAALFLTIKHTVGIRVSEADERVGLDFRYHAGYAYPDFNQRVKKAHQQIAWEAEVAAQVRKDVAQGKGGRLREALNTPTHRSVDSPKPFNPRASTSHPLSEAEDSLVKQRTLDQVAENSPKSGASVRPGTVGSPEPGEGRRGGGGGRGVSIGPVGVGGQKSGRAGGGWVEGLPVPGASPALASRSWQGSVDRGDNRLNLDARGSSVTDDGEAEG